MLCLKLLPLTKLPGGLRAGHVRRIFAPSATDRDSVAVAAGVGLIVVTSAQTAISLVSVRRATAHVRGNSGPSNIAAPPSLASRYVHW